MKHSTTSTTTAQWDFAEITLSGPQTGNPYREVSFGAGFSLGSRTIRIDGFYDGGGVYRVRFMPDTQGTWTFITYSSVSSLSGIEGTLNVVAPDDRSRGPVYVQDGTGFAYADRSAFFPVGTTAYAWAHQSATLREQTLATLAGGPFNKIRMCLFPKHYVFNTNDPERFVFPRLPDGTFDTKRFDSTFFTMFESLLTRLRNLNIEADIILFHPYDRWGFSELDEDECDRYLKYVVARLSAFRNVWWSFANEWDFMKNRTTLDWDRFFRVVQQSDPYQHLRSIHNGKVWYDHYKPWVTHLSVQSSDVVNVDIWRREFGKPVCVDECCYEGDIPNGWGNIDARELVRRLWEVTLRGGFPTGHGETYLEEDDILWWSKGGVLKGDSAPRIELLRRIMTELPSGCNRVVPTRLNANDVVLWAADDSWCLRYTGFRQPRYLDLVLPEERVYVIEIINTWEMTINRIPGVFRGTIRAELPGLPYIAVRCVAADSR